MTTTHVLRLKPGQDLKKELVDFVKVQRMDAGWIVTCVGSLTQYHLRFANQSAGPKMEGHFEIVSLSGTLSQHGSHLHLAVSDSKGLTTGGHLLDDNIIFTTAEIVIQQSDEYLFKREKDGTTAWEELQVTHK
jgi:uncharacterized protein